MHTLEWHHPNFTPTDSDFCIEQSFSIRAEMYNVSGVPHSQWNGAYTYPEGGAGGGDWGALYPDFLELYETYVVNQTPYSIAISGAYEPGNTEITYDVELLIDSGIDTTVNNTNMHVELFVSEDSIMSYWSIIDTWEYARYVARKYITKSANNKLPISITSAGESEMFSGTFTLSDAWEHDQVYIQAVVQNLDTYEIFQATSWNINDLDPDPDGDGLTYLYDNLSLIHI